MTDGGTDLDMRIEQIEKLVDLVARTGVKELTLQENDRRVTIKKGTVAPPAPGFSATAREAPPQALVSAPVILGEESQR